MNLDTLRQQGEPGDIILVRGSGWLSRLICEGQRPLTKYHDPSLWSHVALFLDPETIAESTIDFEPFGAYTEPPSHTEPTPESPVDPDYRPPHPDRLNNGAQYNYLTTLKGKEMGMLLKFPLTDEQRVRVMQKADDLIKERNYYNITGLIGALLSYTILRRLGIGQHNLFTLKDTLFCSDFVQSCYTEVGIDFTADFASSNTAPEHIAQFEMDGLRQVIL
jgi:hypothetical protein